MPRSPWSVAYGRTLLLSFAIDVLASGGVFATANRAVNDKVVIINPLDCNNKIAALPENTFCIAKESESVARAIVDDILKANLTPALIRQQKEQKWRIGKPRVGLHSLCF